MIELQHIIDSKRELLSRETYSRNPINYSEGMADDQKDRYIQYLAEQNQDLRLTNDAMKLVLAIETVRFGKPVIRRAQASPIG